MKILYIIDNLCNGGAQRLLLDICVKLNEIKDVEYKLVSLSNQFDFEEYKSDVNFTPVIDINVKISIFNKNIIHIEKLENIIREYKPDIIHTHIFITEIISRSCTYPNAIWFSHCHDNMPSFKKFTFDTLTDKRRLTNFIERLYLKKRYKINNGNNFITISKNTHDFFNLNFNKYPLFLLRNAINYNRFYRHNKFENINNKKVQIINVGSFQKKKNQKLLIEIANTLNKRKFNFEMHLYGDGSEFENIKELIRNNKLDSFVILHGKTNNIEQKMWEADIYLHTAYYEPLGLVLIEAMASGLPVITLDGKGNKDLIQDGKNGFILSTQNSELFANKIEELWSDKKKYIDIVLYAQEFAKKYDIDNYISELLNIYKNAINNKVDY